MLHSVADYVSCINLISYLKVYVVALEPEAYFKVLEFLLSEETNRNRNRPKITTTPSFWCDIWCISKIFRYEFLIQHEISNTQRLT